MFIYMENNLMSQAHMVRLPTSQVRHTGKTSCVEYLGEMKIAVPEWGYYRFTETGIGCKPLAVMGPSLDAIHAFFRENSQRGIDNTIAEMPDIYMGYSTYAGVRFGRSLRPVADVSMNLFDSATQLVPIVSVMTNAASGSLALNGAFSLNNPGLSVPMVAGATANWPRLIVESFLGAATVADGVSRVVKLHKSEKKTGAICAVFSYLPQKGMTRVARGRLHFGEIDYSSAFERLFAA